MKNPQLFIDPITPKNVTNTENLNDGSSWFAKIENTHVPNSEVGGKRKKWT